uniref:Uncharacterized protein n=1 Tax=Homalodisca liturata TaxID=320908 RepID=A0A1B6IXM4_9HEMI
MFYDKKLHLSTIYRHITTNLCSHHQIKQILTTQDRKYQLYIITTHFENCKHIQYDKYLALKKQIHCNFCALSHIKDISHGNKINDQIIGLNETLQKVTIFDSSVFKHQA